MVLTASRDGDIGRKAPDFTLPDAHGRQHSLADCRGSRGLVVMFICNHCPYVQAVGGRIAALAGRLRAAEIGVVAINPNDWTHYPADAPAQMPAFAAQHGFDFPYLADESQATARAYGAVCTPDFFGYNAELELHYRGRLDDVRHGPATPDTVHELYDAMLMIAETGRGPAMQTASMGCSIKWRHAA